MVGVRLPPRKILSLIHIYVIHKVVEWHLYVRCWRLSYRIRDPARVEADVSLRFQSCLAKPLADVAVTEVVDQGIADDACVANRQAFSVIGRNLVRRLTREL